MATAAVGHPAAAAAAAGAGAGEGDGKERAPDVLLEQSFAQLEEALEGGIWEADGDDMSLYVCDGTTPGDGPAGAVFLAQGPTDAEAELVHRLRGGEGARVGRLSVGLVCEELEAESFGTFTVGLAYDEDFEEAALLALTLRHPRLPPGEPEEAGGQPPPVELRLNGEAIEADIGSLPVRLELDAELCWGSAARTVALRYRICQEGGGNPGPPRSSEASAGFYTTNRSYDSAQALCLRGTGTIRVKLLYLRCCATGEGT